MCPATWPSPYERENSSKSESNAEKAATLRIVPVSDGDHFATVSIPAGLSSSHLKTVRAAILMRPSPHSPSTEDTRALVRNASANACQSLHKVLASGLSPCVKISQ